jgi:hypothetical protein
MKCYVCVVARMSLSIMEKSAYSHEFGIGVCELLLILK